MGFPLRLRGVVGLEGRVNDVLFHPAARRSAGPPSQHDHTLVYWGGDVQDYPEVMQSHRDNRHYLRWNLESTAQLLSRHFPTKHIIVIRPARIEYKSISCYDNFVTSNKAGVPQHTPAHGALLHLQGLLENVSERLKNMSSSELCDASSVTQYREEDVEQLQNPAADVQVAGTSRPGSDMGSLGTVSVSGSRLSLAAFSKGCVVLNQMLHELHHARTRSPRDTHTLAVWARVAALWWLDGGHAGGGGGGAGARTWPTERPLLRTLAALDVDIHIHVSPYQVCDETRPWIGQEEKVFTATLRKLGAKVQRHLHAGGESGSAGGVEGAGGERSLYTHFQVLDNFVRTDTLADTDT